MSKAYVNVTRVHTLYRNIFTALSFSKAREQQNAMQKRKPCTAASLCRLTRPSVFVLLPRMSIRWMLAKSVHAKLRAVLRYQKKLTWRSLLWFSQSSCRNLRMGFITSTSGDMVFTSCMPDVLCTSAPNSVGLGRGLEGSTSASGSRPLLTAAYALLVCVAASDNCSFTSSLIPSNEPCEGENPKLT